MPDVRRAGKPEEGTVSIAVRAKRSEVVVQVSDDGAGMDRDAIRRKAIERGLMKSGRARCRIATSVRLRILETGFSTARRSARSPVAASAWTWCQRNQAARRLAGTSIRKRGKGSEFTVRLPFTLAVTQAVMVKLGDSTYAMPMSSVQGVARMPRKELDRRIEQKNPTCPLRWRDLPDLRSRRPAAPAGQPRRSRRPRCRC
jgi:chemosensory pili system protein ChpA (sensor histidine kinase/response regulator)